MKIAKTFLRESFFYTLGDVLNRTAKFFLIPFYTNTFSQAEYGLLEQVLIGIAFVDIAVTFSLSNTLLRLYYDYNGEEKKKLFGAAISIVLATSGFILFVILFFEVLDINIYFSDNRYFFYIVPYTALISITSIGMVLLRIQKNAKAYSGYTFLKTVLELVLIIFFIASLGKGVEGFLQGSVIAATAMTLLVSFKILRKSAVFTRQPSYYVKYIKFGSPLILNEFAGWFLVSYDKIIIKNHYGFGDLALYGLAVQVVSIFKFLLEGILKAFHVITYDQFKKISASYHKLIQCFLALFCFIGIGFIMFSEEIILVISNRDYLPSAKIVGYLLPTRIFMLYYYLLIIVLYYYRETVFITMVTVAASIASWILFPIFIRAWQFEGAALVSNAVYIFIALALSLRLKKYVDSVFDVLNYLAIAFLASSIALSRLDLAFSVRLVMMCVFGAVFVFLAAKGFSSLDDARIGSIKSISKIFRNWRGPGGS